MVYKIISASDKNYQQNKTTTSEVEKIQIICRNLFVTFNYLTTNFMFSTLIILSFYLCVSDFISMNSIIQLIILGMALPDHMRLNVQTGLKTFCVYFSP